jgi:hypothetical protein
VPRGTIAHTAVQDPCPVGAERFAERNPEEVGRRIAQFRQPDYRLVTSATRAGRVTGRPLTADHQHTSGGTDHRLLASNRHSHYNPPGTAASSAFPSSIPGSHSMRTFGVAALIGLVFSVSAFAQPPAGGACAMPSPPTATAEPSLFTREQAVQLADLVWRRARMQVDVVGDQALAAFLQSMADRMVAAAGAPPVRVTVIDIPEVNAMTMPGRVYVARKLIAFAENEDEVAGVLAHEIGHGLSGDFERAMSAAWRALLNVTAVGDARDVEDKYHRMLDAVLDGKRFDASTSEDAQQENADRLAVWLMARVGYQPQAFERVWNRLQELHSRTGSWLTDLVGMTSPAARRLRITRAAAEALPASCIGPRAAAEQPFAEWRTAVLAASRATSSSGVPVPRPTNERKLSPELRSTVSFLKFSPDGRHVLAQDDASIYLFARDGLTFTHRLDAPDARHAQFSPDSSAVVFSDRNYRVERWSVASGAREWVREVVPTKPCAQSELSADGAYLACVTSDRDVRIYDVATGAQVFNKEFYLVDQAAAGIVIGASPGDDQGFELLKVRFSPDCRYLVLARNAVAMCVDLTTRNTISLPGALRDRLGLSFAFLADGRVIGLHYSNPEQSGIVTFPDGKVVSKLNLGQHALAAPTHGDRYVLVGQVPNFAVGMVDLGDTKLKGGSKTSGFDVYDDHYVAELRNGEIAVYRMGNTDPVEFAAIPPGPLGGLRAVSVDRDFTTLAASQNTRGAAWDLASGKGLLTRPFSAAYVDGTIASLDFPGDSTQRALVRIQPSTQGAQVIAAIQEPPAQGGGPPKPIAAPARVSSQEYRRVSLAGTFFAAAKVGSGSQPDSPAVLDATTGKLVWARSQPKSAFDGMAADAWQGTLLVSWPYTQAEAKTIVEAHPELARRADALPAKKSELYVVEIFDLATGAPKNRFVSPARPLGTFLSDRNLVVSLDKMNRTLVHDLASGERVGRALGLYLDVEARSGRVAMMTGRRELAVCALPGLDQLATFTFPTDVAFARLASDGKRLLVMTTGQVVYTMEVGK